MASTPPPPPDPPAPPSAYPAPETYTPYPQPYYTPAVPVFRRNAMLIVAQVLAIIQGVLAMLFGIGVILIVTLDRSTLQTAINNNNLSINGNPIDLGTASGVIIGIGAVVLLIGVLITFLAVRAGRPSQIARWFLACIEILFLLAALRNLGVGGNAYNSALVDVVWSGLIILGLIVWPATYAAYARRNL